MKIGCNASPLIISEGFEKDGTVMGMSNTAALMMAKHLRDTVYKHKTLAVVRELACNAIDEHVKYGVQRPVEIGLRENEGDTEFYVRDFAKGLSDFGVRNVFGPYGESTKSKDNNSIGGYGIGEVIELERNSVDDHRANTCSFGAHVGALEYAKDFARNKLVVVKVNPKDVVSVPTDYGCQKCRVTGYTVLGEFETKITAPATKSDGKVLLNKDKQDDEVFKTRISNYLIKKANAGEGYVTVKQIQSIFSPKTPDKTRVLAAVKDLGYFYATNKFGDGKLWIEL
jgi:anti-sigma regulatory factor (Ser/Thr protein kinase)